MSNKSPEIVLLVDDKSDDEEAGQVESTKKAKTGEGAAAGTNID